jgi:hypothetical protein
MAQTIFRQAYSVMGDQGELRQYSDLATAWNSLHSLRSQQDPYPTGTRNLYAESKVTRA